MNPLLRQLLSRYMAPAGEGGSDTSGADSGDRGDDWAPTDDDAGDTTKAAAKGGEGDDDVDPENPDKGDDRGADKKDKKVEAKKDGAADDKDKGEKDDAEKDKGEKDDADKADKDKRKDDRIPASRHKAILEKERAAREEVEKRLAKYEQGDRVAATNDAIKRAEDQIAALDKEYAKLLVDGDHEKAADKRREMRKLEDEVVERKSDMKAQAATSLAIERVRYDTAVDRLEAAYDVLNPKSDDFDEEKSQEVLDLSVVYRSRGLTPAEAIQKAAKTLLGAETKKQERATDAKPRVDKEDAEAEKKKLAKEEERRRAQVDKNLDANKRQPADTSKIGADSDKAGGGIDAKSVMKMSQNEFAKLDEATLSRLRGDTLA